MGMRCDVRHEGEPEFCLDFILTKEKTERSHKTWSHTLRRRRRSCDTDYCIRCKHLPEASDDTLIRKPAAYNHNQFTVATRKTAIPSKERCDVLKATNPPLEMIVLDSWLL